MLVTFCPLQLPLKTIYLPSQCAPLTTVSIHSSLQLGSKPKMHLSALSFVPTLSQLSSVDFILQCLPSVLFSIPTVLIASPMDTINSSSKMNLENYSKMKKHRAKDETTLCITYKESNDPPPRPPAPLRLSFLKASSSQLFTS